MPRLPVARTAAVLVVAALLATGLALEATTRYGPLTQPWGYVALAFAGVGAVGAMLLGLSRLAAAADGS